MQKIIIIGGKTGALEVNGIIEDINRVAPTYELVGILDDDLSIHGTKVGELTVLGPLKMAGEISGVRYVFAIGSVKTQHQRLTIIAALNLGFDEFETFQECL